MYKRNYFRKNFRVNQKIFIEQIDVEGMENEADILLELAHIVDTDQGSVNRRL